jgi:hypothetical protein
MKEKSPLKQILLHLAEEDIPRDHDPWEAIQRRLNKTQAGQDKPVRRPQLAGLAAVALILLAGVIFLTTPEGQVAAEGFLHLFVNTEKNIRPISTEVPTGGFQSTHTSVPLSPGTSTQSPTKETGNYIYGLTLSAAEVLAQYPVRAPGSLPAGFQLSDISFDRQAHSVTLLYDYMPYSGPSISIQQCPTLEMQPIGPSVVINQYQEGEITVEWVDGGWYIPLGAAQQVWERELPMRTFRWAQDGYFFTVWFIPTTPRGPLTMEEMKALVEMMIGGQ